MSSYKSLFLLKHPLATENEILIYTFKSLLLISEKLKGFDLKNLITVLEKINNKDV